MASVSDNVLGPNAGGAAEVAGDAAAVGKAASGGHNTELEHVDDNALAGSLAPGTAYRKKVERRLVWKLDAKMSLLVIIYILNYIDRNNASAAR